MKINTEYGFGVGTGTTEKSERSKVKRKNIKDHWEIWGQETNWEWQIGVAKNECEAYMGG